MKKLFFLLITPFLLSAQDQVVINTRNSTVTLHNVYDYEYIIVDSNYNYYNLSYWGGESKKDTFLSVLRDIVRKENITTVITAIIGTSYKLNRQLKDKSWLERDSILNAVMQKECRYKPSRGYFRVSSVITPIHYYQGKYPYVDTYETYYEVYKKRKWYTSEATRIFIIGEVLYYVYVRNNDLKTTTSILKSRKAVCCDFKRLVNNITIIEKEEPSPSK